LYREFTELILTYQSNKKRPQTVARGRFRYPKNKVTGKSKLSRDPLISIPIGPTGTKKGHRANAPVTSISLSAENPYSFISFQAEM
jgi:hypothetical protein